MGATGPGVPGSASVVPDLHRKLSGQVRSNIAPLTLYWL